MKRSFDPVRGRWYSVHLRRYTVVVGLILQPRVPLGFTRSDGFSFHTRLLSLGRRFGILLTWADR